MLHFLIIYIFSDFISVTIVHYYNSRLEVCICKCNLHFCRLLFNR